MTIKKKVNAQNKKVDAHKKELKIISKALYQLSLKVFRIEKVSESHAKCIGEIREEKICQTKKL